MLDLSQRLYNSEGPPYAFKTTFSVYLLVPIFLRMGGVLAHFRCKAGAEFYGARGRVYRTLAKVNADVFYSPATPTKEVLDKL